MLNDYQEYLQSCKEGRIRTHKDALKYFNVRYSSFIQHYPQEGALPACTLAQNGFFFDNNSRSIKCFECNFNFNDLSCDCLSDILNDHMKNNNKCSQAISSLKHLLEQDEEETQLISKEDVKENIVKSPFFYSSEDSRLKTFENCRLIIDINSLVKNGFYRVIKDPIKSSLQNEKNLSMIEYVSKSIPTLSHVKCAFCPYECLLFKNSLLNTLYKSPFDEHKEKYSHSCPIFTSLNKMDCGPGDNSPSEFIKCDVLKNQFEWLRVLYEFDSDKSLDLNNIDTLLKLGTKDDFYVTKIPKILEQILEIKISKTMSKPTISSNSVLYIPDSGTKNSSFNTTSDFKQLQEALNKSNNVLNEKVYHTAYTQYEKRLETFRNWPATMSQQPSDLANAGFFYFGIKDMVKCFFCNGGLKNWDANDDPYQDHVRWFPKCQYIKQLMGAEYVEKIREKFKDMESGFNESNQKSAQTASNSLISDLPPDSTLAQKYHSLGSKRSVSPRTLNSRLDTNIVRKITESTFILKESIKKAIEIKLSVQETNNNNVNINNLNYGDDFKTPVDLAMFSYEIEQAKKQKENVLNEICDFVLSYTNCNLKAENIRNLIQVKYGCNPLYVRTIRQANSETKRIFCLVTLHESDKKRIDDIINNIEQNLSKDLDVLKNIIIIKTKWSEIEQKLKPLLEKQIDMSTSVGQLNQQQEADTEQKINDESSKINLSFLGNDIKKSTKDLPDEEASKLLEENERLKSERLCVVCLTNEKNVLFLPCAHLTACLECSYSLQTCPMCRAQIQATVRTFT